MRYAIVNSEQIPYKFTKFHDNLEETKKEAERLCKEKNQCFFVIKVIGNVYSEEPTPPLRWDWEKE